MNRFVSGLVLAALMLAVAASPAAAQRDKNTGQRTLQGEVTGHQDAPLEKAVVYLKNTKTLAVRTKFTGPDGKYEFNALAPNIDYEIYAVYAEEKSDTKTLNGFDTRPKAQINLHIGVDAAKKP